MKIRGIFYSMVLLSNLAIAQDNSTEIEKFKEGLKKKEDERIRKIDEYLSKYNVPKEGYYVNGDYFYLHNINDEGMPVYYSTKSERGKVSFYTKVDTIFYPAAFNTVKSFQSDKAKRLKIETESDIKDLRILVFTTQKVIYLKIDCGKSVDINLKKFPKGELVILLTLADKQQLISQFKNN